MSKSPGQCRSTSQIMHWVLLGTLPLLLTQIYYFGWGILLQVVIAGSSALLFEAGILWLRRRPLGPTLSDGSALLSGVLLALALPPLAPGWLAVIGTLFAIVIAKQLYGGLGQNLFNPAMVGYVVLLISFPGPMSTWPPSRGPSAVPPTLAASVSMILQTAVPPAPATSDAVTQATPLDRHKSQQRLAATIPLPRRAAPEPSQLDPAWLALNLSALLGGLLLLVQRLIQWQIPGSLLASLLLSATIGGWFDPVASGSPGLQLFSGATLLGAFFIATDPVTAATTPRGRLLFGALIGLLIYLIRRFGDYPDGIAFAVLIANMLVPWLDGSTQPRVYGKEP